MLPCIKTVLFRQSIYALDKPLIAADIRTWVYGAFPTDPADMKENPAVSDNMWSPKRFSLPYPSKSWKVVAPESSTRALTLWKLVPPLYTIRDCKRVMPVGRMMQQPDTGKGSQMPAYLFLTGITAAEHIP